MNERLETVMQVVAVVPWKMAPRWPRRWCSATA